MLDAGRSAVQPKAVGSIYTPIAFTPPQQATVRAIAGESPVYFGNGGGPADEAAFREAEIVFGSVSPEWILDSRNLRWAQLDSTGFGQYQQLDWGSMASRVTMTNLGGFFAEPVVETALAGLLALYRGIDRLVRLQEQRRWEKLDVRARLRPLHGATMLIVGYGAIGRRFAQVLEPFGCKLCTFAQSSSEADIHSVDALDAVLPEADVVFAALPETGKTIGLFHADRLARFKKGAVFVNVGRGSVVDETALVGALEGGALGGAVLDVTVTEPLPPDHPLWQLPTVILTQHTAGGGEDEMDRKIAFFARNLRRYREGRPLRSVIDWGKGY
jgi:phosphoglycerate dehydrogenase-like enzyme